MTLQPAGVHAPLPAACAARRLPPDPALRAAGQRQPAGQPGAGARVVARGTASRRERAGQTTRRPHRRRPSCARTAATRWWCCRSSCATARFGHRQHHDRRSITVDQLDADHGVRWIAACAARTTAPGRCVAGRCHSTVARRKPPAFVSTVLSEASRAAGSRHQRRPIAIAAALNDHRGVRRGFLPRGLCNTCPDAARARDRLRVRAGVTQALTVTDCRDRKLHGNETWASALLQ